jgi:hypothetical protein
MKEISKYIIGHPSGTTQIFIFTAVLNIYSFSPQCSIPFCPDVHLLCLYLCCYFQGHTKAIPKRKRIPICGSYVLHFIIPHRQPQSEWAQARRPARSLWTQAPHLVHVNSLLQCCLQPFWLWSATQHTAGECFGAWFDFVAKHARKDKEQMNTRLKLCSHIIIEVEIFRTLAPESFFI